MTPLTRSFTEDPTWHEKIGSVHATTAIESGQLTIGQVSDGVNGQPVWEPPIVKSLGKHIAAATQTVGDVPVCVPVNVPESVLINVGVNVGVNVGATDHRLAEESHD